MLPVARAEQLDEAFVAIKSEKADVVVVGPDALYVSRMREISDMASTRHLPLIGPNRLAAELGALIGYGYDFRGNWRRTAAYIDRILRGAKPSDLPVEQPTKFELIINAKTAKARHRRRKASSTAFGTPSSRPAGGCVPDAPPPSCGASAVSNSVIANRPSTVEYIWFLPSCQPSRLSKMWMRRYP